VESFWREGSLQGPPEVEMAMPKQTLRPHPPKGPPGLLRVKEEPKQEPSASSGWSSFEPATRPPAIGDDKRAAFILSLTSWLRGNMTIVELEDLLT
jgi:hypothetical protein